MRLGDGLLFVGLFLCLLVKNYTRRYLMDTNDLIGIENKIDYKFRNKDLLQQAFVRKSYSAENGGSDNEVLEFIGDKVLDLIVVQMLTEEYGYMASDCDDFDQNDCNEFYSDCDEGELTEIKRNLVQRENLAERINMLGFADFLIMGNSDVNNHVDEKDSVKEDLFEAIIGAVALDCNWDMEILKQVIEQMLEPDFKEEDDNYIQLLQEWSLQKYGILPLYHVEDYNTAHWYMTGYVYNLEPLEEKRSTYKAYLKIEGFDKIILGFGSSQKEARKDAAKYAYTYLEKNNLLFTIRDEIENPNRQDAINQLEILARRGYFSIPQYNFTEKQDSDGNPIWYCECAIDEYGDTCKAEAHAKKDAKKSAAFEMLNMVLMGE